MSEALPSFPQNDTLWVACCKQCTFKGKPMDATDLALMRMATALGHIYCPVCEGDQWRYESVTIVEETSNDQESDHVSGRQIL